MSRLRPVVAVTVGDVAGIGPEVVVRAVTRTECSEFCDVVLIGDPDILTAAAESAAVSIPLHVVSSPDSPEDLRHALADAHQLGAIPCWNPAGDIAKSAPRRAVSAAAGRAAFEYLSSAIRAAQSRIIDAIATAPLNKEALHLAGHDFPGHTEILADQCGVSRFAMMLHLPESRLHALRSAIRGAGPEGRSDAEQSGSGFGLSIAHVTLHTSIASVPGLLTIDGILQNAVLMDQFLSGIGCRRRAIAVCALNPHGGENGLFGDEEQTLIAPAVQLAAARGINVVGPLPVDTLIRRAVLGEFDGVVAMYHDQGHIPVKLLGFDAAVNITLGLPIIRTSPTHGTAFDRAWNPATPADESGMLEAILMAARMAGRGED